MPFIPEVLKYRTVSIIGVEKNTGKTECLNYILGKLCREHKRIAVTSIGLDGERVDQVSLTAKPEITLYEGMLFSTSEKHYRERHLISEVIDVSRECTALGKVVTAKALSSGTVLLSGPSTSSSLRQWTEELQSKYGAELCLIDGALSRKSLASPALSQAIILATGAAYSAHIPTLVRHTRFLYDLIALEPAVSPVSIQMSQLRQGIWAIDNKGQLRDLNLPSAFALDKMEGDLFTHGTRFFLSGALNNRFLQFIVQNGQADKAEIIVPDFTRIFITPELFYAYTKQGGRISVLQKTKLIAVCINPVSPQGYTLHSEKLSQAMEAALGIPVYDIKKEASLCN